MAIEFGASQKWPPPEHQPFYNEYAEHGAWYSGNAGDLANFYTTEETKVEERRLFWSRRSTTTSRRRLQLHVPIAGDIASTSADMLFSEPPTISFDNEDESSKERLDWLIARTGLHNTLLEGAEIAAALGGVYLRPVWDKTVADHPLLTVIHADAAVPEFKWGVLQAVTFWREVQADQSRSEVWRHLERHEKGRIFHGLYEGNRDELGVATELQAHPATEDLVSDEMTKDGAIPTPGVEGLVVRYVPNVRPNRRHRGAEMGRSDYQGLEATMDALDEAYTSWMRDIRLAKARLVVPEEYLKRDTTRKGQGAAFDVEQEIYAPLNAPLTDPEGKQFAPTLIQPAIRFEEHKQTCLELLDRIVTGAGYSPQSFGLKIENRAESGKALRIRDKKSFTTQAKKQRYWKPAVEDVLEIMMILDQQVFGSKVTPVRPNLEFSDSVSADPRDSAEAVELMHRANAASVETKVKMLHPEWSETQVDEEVSRLTAEQGMNVPDPTTVRPPGADDEDEDGAQE